MAIELNQITTDAVTFSPRKDLTSISLRNALLDGEQIRKVQLNVLVPRTKDFGDKFKMNCKMMDREDEKHYKLFETLAKNNSDGVPFQRSFSDQYGVMELGIREKDQATIILYRVSDGKQTKLGTLADNKKLILGKTLIVMCSVYVQFYKNTAKLVFKVQSMCIVPYEGEVESKEEEKEDEEPDFLTMVTKKRKHDDQDGDAGNKKAC